MLTPVRSTLPTFPGKHRTPLCGSVHACSAWHHLWKYTILWWNYAKPLQKSRQYPMSEARYIPWVIFPGKNTQNQLIELHNMPWKHKTLLDRSMQHLLILAHCNPDRSIQYNYGRRQHHKWDHAVFESVSVWHISLNLITSTSIYVIMKGRISSFYGLII